ncbi:MAG: hypothetical protein H0U77_03320 [Nocardioidaceae bacterium]|nr:hypothetical protein [Nocardioidaceae bacterium]
MVFDVGAVAKDGEHVHATIVRQVQARLGYARDEVVAREEIRLERDGLQEKFLALAEEVHGRPWSELVGQARVSRHFSMVMNRLDPIAHPAPLDWQYGHVGGIGRAQSADEAVADLGHMIAARAPGRTLFIGPDRITPRTNLHMSDTDPGTSARPDRPQLQNRSAGPTGSTFVMPLPPPDVERCDPLARAGETF